LCDFIGLGIVLVWFGPHIICHCFIVFSGCLNFWSWWIQPWLFASP